MKSEHEDSTRLNEFPMLWLKGFLMGSADVVPGVSGGTMALILGIYERLLSAIKSVNTSVIKDVLRLKWFRALKQIHVLFLVMLFSGIVTALAFFTKVVPLQIYMFTAPEIVFGLFFGLIVGSIYILIKAIQQPNLSMCGWILIGTGIGLWVVQLVPTETPEHPLFVLLSGIIAITAMILPGISGSYLLLIMRKYDYVLSAIAKIGGSETMDGLVELAPFILGAVIGLALFSRVLSWLLDRYHRATLSVLIGFLLGSLLVIWPFQQREYVEQVRAEEVISLDDPRVASLPTIEEAAPLLPEYERVVLQAQQGQATLQTVKRKLIHSTPFWPKAPEYPDRWMGFVSMFVGLLLVTGLERLR